MYRHFLFLFAAFFILSGIADAQTPFPTAHRKWEFFGFGGGSFLGSSDHPTPIRGEDLDSWITVNLEYESGYSAGFRIGETLGDHWGADFEYSYSDQPLKFTDLMPELPSLRLEQRIHRFLYNMLYYPLPRSSRVRPYVFGGAGMGLFYTKGSSEREAALEGIDIKNRWKVAFNWGGGLKLLLRDHLAARFQLGDQVTGVPNYGFPSVAQVGSDTFTPGFKPNGNLHNWLLVVGLAYQWGEKLP